MSCDKLVDLLKNEKQDLISEIEKDKWYLSEKAGYDVGWNTAKKHFVETYLNNWAEGYRKCYCSLVCENRCEEYKKW